MTASQPSPEWAHDISIQLPNRTKNFSQRFVDCSITRTSLDRHSIPIRALMQWVHTDIEAALFPDHGQEMRAKYRKAQVYPIVERSHEHERIRGTVPFPNTIIASNLCRCPGIQP